MFDGHTNSPKSLNLPFDDAANQYHLITNLTGAMAKQYVCNTCNKGCTRGVTHICDETCRACMSNPPCVSDGVPIPCSDCSRHFRSHICFDNYKKRPPGKNKKNVCEQRRCCSSCGASIARCNDHECNRPFYTKCGQNRKVEHLCYMRPLQNELPSCDNIMYVFYGFETTQDTRYSETATEHVPNLVCSKCEHLEDIEHHCLQCGERKLSFWEDAVGDMLTYLCEPRQWVKKIIVYST
jgi:hypothetical protein